MDTNLEDSVFIQEELVFPITIHFRFLIVPDGLLPLKNGESLQLWAWKSNFSHFSFRMSCNQVSPKLNVILLLSLTILGLTQYRRQLMELMLQLTDLHRSTSLELLWIKNRWCRDLLYRDIDLQEDGLKTWSTTFMPGSRIWNGLSVLTFIKFRHSQELTHRFVQLLVQIQFSDITSSLMSLLTLLRCGDQVQWSEIIRLPTLLSLEERSLKFDLFVYF